MTVDLAFDDVPQAYFVPAHLGEKSMCPRKAGTRCCTAAAYRSIVGSAEAHDAVDDGRDVLGAVVDLHQEAVFGRFQHLTLRYSVTSI